MTRRHSRLKILVFFDGAGKTLLIDESFMAWTNLKLDKIKKNFFFIAWANFIDRRFLITYRNQIPDKILKTWTKFIT